MLERYIIYNITWGADRTVFNEMRVHRPAILRWDFKITPQKSRD